MQVTEETLLLLAFIMLLIGAAIGSWVTRLLLRYPFGRDPMTGREAMIGQKARVVVKKNGYLRVFLNSQVWTAESPDYDDINKDDFVVIRAVDNLTMTVAPYQSPKGSVTVDLPDNQAS